MRIGVDARPLCVPTFGIGRYLGAILDRLVVHEDIEWFLYADRPLLRDFEAASNVHVRTFTAHNRALSLFRTQWQYAWWAMKDGLDLFWSPRHHLPLLLPPGIKSVVTIHDLVWKRFPHTMLRQNLLVERVLMPASLRRADAIIAVSQATREDIEAFYPGTRNKVSVITEAADRVGVDSPVESAPYFVFLGTLEPRKNLLTLVEAFSLAQSGLDPKTRLVIIGAEGWNLQLAPITHAFGCEDKVDLLGYVDDETLHRYLAGAIGLCLPSLYEGFGLPALEAMQHGTPVIGSNRSSIPEVIGEGGILIDPTSPDDIAEAMSRLAGDRALRAALSERARRQASTFSWDSAAAETRSLFEAQIQPR